LAATLLAWVSLIWVMSRDPAGTNLHTQPDSDHDMHAMHAMHAMVTHPVTAPHAHGAMGWRLWTLLWTLMVVAMMWPLWSRTVDRAWRATFRGWRTLGLALFLVTVTGLWLAIGVIARMTFLATAPVAATWTWPLCWLLVALLALRSSNRRVLLARCQPLRVVAPRGRRAVATAVRIGWRSWPRCAVLCGPVMVAMAGPHQPAVMLGGSAAVWWEQRYPRRHRDPVPAVVLTVTAIAVVVLGATGADHG
jgi:hypothetical protein